MAGYGCGYGHDNDGNVLNYGDHQDAGITGRDEWEMIEHPCNCGLNYWLPVVNKFCCGCIIFSSFLLNMKSNLREI